MPRKSGVPKVKKFVRAVEKSALTNVKPTKCNKDDKKLSKNIYIGASNALRWNILKNKLNYESDVELVQYLLELAEPTINREESGSGTAEPESENVTKEHEARGEEPQDKPAITELPGTAVDSHDSPPAAPSPEDDARDADWQPRAERETSARRSTRKTKVKPRARRSTRNHRHHRKRRHHRGSTHAAVLASDAPAVPAEEHDDDDLNNPPPAPTSHEPETSVEDKPADEQQILREDNHKHHHDKHKVQTRSFLKKETNLLQSSSSTSRGRKKHKRKDKNAQSDASRPEKVRIIEAAATAEVAAENEEPVAALVEPPADVHEEEKVVVEEPPRIKTPEVEPEVPEHPLLSAEKHRRKHKHRESKKKSHDIRRAPTDGIPVERTPSPSPSTTSLLPPTLELPPEPEHVPSPSSDLRTNGVSNNSLPPPNLSPEVPLPTTTITNAIIPEVMPTIGITPQRVAIRIKLCGDCGCRHVQDACPLLRPILHVPDAVSRSNWPSSISKGSNFSKDSLPSHLFSLEERDAAHGLSVIAKEPIARYTQFGPLVGDRIREMDIPDDFNMRDIWEVCSPSEKFYLSTMDADRSNWLRFMRPAPSKEQRNVAAVSRGSDLYFVSLCALEPGTELLFWLEYSISGWARKKMEKTNCGGCNLRFSHSLYYRLHCSVFHDPNFSLTIRKYHCKVCGLAVLGKENIMRHAAEQHAGKGAYQCQFCKKFFLRLNYLEMHRTYGCAANPQRTRPLCDFCGRKFCQPQKLKVHIKRMHSDMAEVLKEFQCKMCLKLLGSRAALQRHLKEVHHKDLVGACTCDRCGKMFQNKSNLKIHMLTHSGVKPFSSPTWDYRCNEGSCSAAFTTKQCLQFHYKKVHGFAEDNMPKIERCVAYTFDAYAGGGSVTDERPGSGLTASPPFTPAGTEDSTAASPAPSIPSLDDDDDDEDEEDLSHCSSNLPLPHSSEHLESSVGSMQPPVSSPTPPPPTLRQVSPNLVSPVLDTSRPGGSILSKASKKWMGDVVMPPVTQVVEPQQMQSELSKRWPIQEQLTIDTRMDSPESVEKKWSIECIPGMRSPEMLSARRSEIAYSRALRVSEQDMQDQIRRSPSPLGGEFSPLRRTEPSASLLVEAALDAAERDLTGKLADLKPLIHESGNFLPRMNGIHNSESMSEAEYNMMTGCSKPGPRGIIPETGLDMSYKQYDNDMVNNDLNSEFRVMRSPEQVSFEQEQGLDMSRSSGYAGATGYARYTHTDLLPPHLHPHHRAAVAAAGLMYEMEPARCTSPPVSPPPPPPSSYQAELLRHHWHHLTPSSHHTLDLSTARVQQPSPDQSMSPPPPTSYQNYPLSPSPYHAPPPPRPNTPPYHHYSGYY